MFKGKIENVWLQKAFKMLTCINQQRSQQKKTIWAEFEQWFKVDWREIKHNKQFGTDWPN